jgi:hypothetical protein
VTAFALIPLVAGMKAQFPGPFGIDFLLACVLALGIWCPSWLALAKRVERGRSEVLG